jgi:hypothetical protein
MAKVTYHGKVLSGEATPFQRALLAKLEGKTNFGQKISKAEASVRIDKAMKKSKTATATKPATATKTGEATIAQRCLLAKLEGKTNYGKKISFADASRRIAKLLAK